MFTTQKDKGVVFLVICTTSCAAASAKYCDKHVCVCLSLCPRGCLRKHTRDPYQNYVHVVYGRGLVLLRRRYDTLCTSGFVDDN